MSEDNLWQSEECRTDVYALLTAQRTWLHPDGQDAARDDFVAIIEHFPTHGLSLRALAEINRKTGRREEWIRSLEQLIESYPDDPEIVLDLLEADPAREQDENLKVLLKKVASQGYESSRFLDYLASVALRSGDAEESVQLLRSAWEKNPDDDTLRARYGRILWLTAEPIAAAEILSGMSAEAKDATLLRMEAVGRLLGGDGRGARLLLESLVALDPQDLYSIWWLADLEERRGRSWRADLLFQQVAEGPHRNGAERVIGALALLVLNESVRAEQLLLRPLEAGDDTVADVRFMLGVIQLVEKRFVKAAELFAEVRSLDLLLLRREFRLVAAHLRPALVAEFIEKLQQEAPDLAMILGQAAGDTATKGE